MSGPEVGATSDTLCDCERDRRCLRSEGREKLEWGHFDRGRFRGQKLEVLFQLIACALAHRQRKRLIDCSKLAIDEYRSKFFFAPEVVVESALMRAYSIGDAVNARLDIADVLK